MVGLKDDGDLEAAAAGSGLNSGTSGGGLNLVHNFDGRPLGLFTGSFGAGAARFEVIWSIFPFGCARGESVWVPSWFLLVLQPRESLPWSKNFPFLTPGRLPLFFCSGTSWHDSPPPGAEIVGLIARPSCGNRGSAFLGWNLENSSGDKTICPAICWRLGELRISGMCPKIMR